MQAQPDFGRRKFCVYNMMTSCLSLWTTKLFMETHFLGGKLEKKTSQMEKPCKQNIENKSWDLFLRRVLKNRQQHLAQLGQFWHFCFNPEPLQAAR